MCLEEWFVGVLWVSSLILGCVGDLRLRCYVSGGCVPFVGLFVGVGIIQ